MEPPFDYDPIWKPIHDPKGVVDPNRYVYKIDFISSRTIVFDTTNKQSCSYKPEQDAYWLSSNGKWILCHRIYLTTGRSVKVKNPVNKKNHNPKRSVKATNYGRCDISSSRVRKQF